MGSCPVTSWQIVGETMEQWQSLFSRVPKSLQMVTAAMKLIDTCSLEEKLSQPRQYVKKQTHYFANKGPSSQSFGFSSIHVQMWELDYKENLAPKNWCLWTVVLEKTLESPLDCKENQSILKEMSPEYSLEGLMMKLKLQYFGHLMQRAGSFEKTLMLGKIEGGRRRGRLRMSWLDGIIYATDTSLSTFGIWSWTGRPGVLQSMGSQRVRGDWASERNWQMK